MRDLLDLNSFSQELNTVHHWEEEIKLMAEEDICLTAIDKENTQKNSSSIGFLYTNLTFSNL